MFLRLTKAPSEAPVSDRVINVFSAAGFKKPNLELFSDEFLENLQTMPQKNLAVNPLGNCLATRYVSNAKIAWYRHAASRSYG